MSITRDTRPVDPQDQARRAVLNDLAKALRGTHKALLEAVKRDFEAQHGPIGGPLKVFKLVMDDPFFAWLRPLSGQMALVDERIDDKAKLEESEMRDMHDAVRALFEDRAAPESFGAYYAARLGADADVAALHAPLLETLGRMLEPPA